MGDLFKKVNRYASYAGGGPHVGMAVDKHQKGSGNKARHQGSGQGMGFGWTAAPPPARTPLSG